MYSPHIRTLAFRRLQMGWSYRKVGNDLDVGASTVHRWKTLSHWGGNASRTRSKTNRRRKRTVTGCPLFGNLVIEYLTNHPYSTMKDLKQYLKSQTGSRSEPLPSISSLRRIIRDRGFTRKRLSGRVFGTPSSDRVQLFKEEYDIALKRETSIVSTDECHFSERVVPLYGYSKKGARCIQRIKRDKTTAGVGKFTLVLSITSDGRIHHELLDGCVKRDRFTAFVHNLPFESDSTILLDNCSIHHGISNIFKEKNVHALFLPPYSPQFQPVELAFSKIKNCFRKKFPFVEGVQKCIEDSIKCVTPEDILNWFRHCDNIRLR